MRATLLLLVLIATAPRLWAGSATPFHLGAQGGVIVPVLINGEGPFPMLLDTGASHSAIDADVAAAVGAEAVAAANVISPAGDAARPIVALEHLQLGPITFDAVLPSVVPVRSFDPDGRLRGVVGQDLLSPLRYTIDFTARVIRWHHAGGPGVELPLVLEDGRFLVEAPQAGVRWRLVPDSGAGGLVLFTGRRPAPQLLDTGRQVALRTAAASTTGREVIVRELVLGGRALRELPAVVVERPERRPAEGDGLLPLHLFERVTFDGPGRRLIVG